MGQQLNASSICQEDPLPKTSLSLFSLINLGAGQQRFNVMFLMASTSTTHAGGEINGDEGSDQDDDRVLIPDS
ncbi:hypothetical protein CICLE_v10029741mg [Citrus x clementina]|uniref:Uncharacterized protein n=1 Tax=Citrus clementina TaxID=85681 RepID=V4SGM8_CITCL|nr:hypothetical protein CICLE_v10029741mg [Citrus x clementina]